MNVLGKFVGRISPILPLPYNFLNSRLELNTIFVQAKLVSVEFFLSENIPQSVEFLIKILSNLTNYEIQNTDNKQFYGAIQTISNALSKQRNSVLGERPQLNEFLYVSSLIYRG